MTKSSGTNQSPWGGSDPYACQIISAENCFLCGNHVTDHKSDEHVFPQWLLRKHELLNHEITLSNRTRISYRQLRITCCAMCNTRYLSQLERRMEWAFRSGAEAVADLPETDLFLWVAKINYGLTFKECFLPFNRANPRDGTIANPDYVKTLKALHGFIQALRMPVRFEKPYPWSIFVLKTHTYAGEMDFDWHGTPWKQLCFTIRSHGVGIIASLMDNAGQRSLYGDVFDKLQGIPLHPIQFDELSAMVVYQASLLDRTPKYISVGPESGERIQVISMPLGGFSFKPIYKDWDLQAYAGVLEFFWQPYGMKYSDIYLGNGSVRTAIRINDSKFPVMDKDGRILSTVDVW